MTLNGANITTYIPMPNLPSSDTQCSICLETVADNIADNTNRPWACITSCNHKFHTECILEWTNINPSCPLCRVDIIMPANTNMDMPAVIHA